MVPDPSCRDTMLFHSSCPKFRYCQKCQVFKLPRMHHCSTCGRCCLKYNHHCKLIANCIGINNYHLYIIFLLMTMCFLLFSLYINLVNTFLNCQIQDYNRLKVASCIFLVFHNIFSANYALLLIKRYLPLCLNNMLCVEDLQINPFFEKADQLDLFDKKRKFFFYQRESIFENVCEMMGTYNIPSWFVLLP